MSLPKDYLATPCRGDGMDQVRYPWRVSIDQAIADNRRRGCTPNFTVCG
jgi:hypothetical protein